MLSCRSNLQILPYQWHRHAFDAAFFDSLNIHDLLPNNQMITKTLITYHLNPLREM